MAYLLDRIKQSLAKEGLSSRTENSRKWLLNKIKNLNPSKQKLMTDKNRLKEKTIIGKMYFYFYDPKTKDKLPFYDKFPLVIPIEEYKNGFLGLNLHYLHPKKRLILLDKLSEYANNSNYDETTKLKLSYGLLSSSKNIFEMKACIKQYLFSNIKSKFLQIDSDEWDIAALLPVENFEGAPKNKVYMDSEDKF
jgi:hypothetical protein